MMFYSPFEIFSNISNDDIMEFNNIQSLPKRTSYEKIKFELLETEFNKKFLSKINKEFFSNIIRKLDERIIFLRGEMNKTIMIEKPQKTINIEKRENSKINKNETERELTENDKNKIMEEVIRLMLSRI